MFKSARLKLTAWYLLIIMLVSLSFSVIIYQTQTAELERFAMAQRLRIERQFLGGDYFAPPPAFDPDLLAETRTRLLAILIIINASILVLSGAAGYLLAGRTLTPIKDMLDEQNRFISDSSHELRTPLTSLKSAMEVYLRDKNLTIKDAKQLITDSIGEVNKLQSLSDELLQLTQFEKPNGYSQLEKVSLKTITAEAVHKISPMARTKNILIKNKIEDYQINVNKYGLMDLLVILLDNAVKYSSAKKTVLLSSKKTDGNIVISVTDQGIGINKEDLPHIFDRFYRADSARAKSGAGGYGLGLSIAKKIADVHHATISVASAPGQGTTFSVSLPA